MKLGIAADHAGFLLKEEIKKKFSTIEWVDFGTNSEEPVDYPDYIGKLAKEIHNERLEKGIAICGSGIGASIVANRFSKVRAALVYDKHNAEMCRRHNNANILTLGGRVLSFDLAFELIEIFLQTKFESGRHQNRLRKIDEIL